MSGDCAPTFPQLIFGRPKLRIELHVEATDGVRHLSLMFTNPQITSKLLRSIGVHRDTVQSLSVNFRVAEAGSGTIILPNHRALLYSDEDQNDTGRLRIALPPTHSAGATVLVAIWDYENGQALVPPDRLRNATVLSPGQYRAEFIILLDGEPMYESAQFVVGKKPEGLIWVPEIRLHKRHKG